MTTQRQPLAQPESLDGLTVGLLDISKARGRCAAVIEALADGAVAMILAKIGG